MSWIRQNVDPFIVGIVGMMVLGLFLPVPDSVVSVLEHVSDAAIFILFLLYGARMSTREVWNGMKNLRLQGAILIATFVAFPILGLATQALAEPLLGSALAAGLLYVTLLPSTVQSSVAFVSVARGNVAGAICAATVSNVLGMLITPLLVLWLMGASGSVGFSGSTSVLLLLLLPFVIGQIAQPFVGDAVRRHGKLTKAWDRLTILLIVLVAVVTATAAGVWSSVSPWALVAGLVLAGLLVTIMLLATWFGGKALGLPLADRIALLMCGSKKSLATGLPMSSVLFPSAVAGPIAVPVILFHQLQLIICAAIARRLGARPEEADGAADAPA